MQPAAGLATPRAVRPPSGAAGCKDAQKLAQAPRRRRSGHLTPGMTEHRTRAGFAG